MNSFRDYLEYAEKYLNLVDENDLKLDVNWLLIPATIITWSGIESFVNNMLDDFSNLPTDMFELHERAFLLEEKIRFIDRGNKIGQFDLEGKEFRRLEDKLLFLIAKFGIKKSDNIKGNTLWQKFQKFKEVRDDLVHPRRSKSIYLDIIIVKEFLTTAKEIICFISEKVWGKKVSF